MASNKTMARRKNKATIDEAAQERAREQEEIDRLLATSWRTRAEELEDALTFARQSLINPIGVLLDSIRRTGEVEGKEIAGKLKLLIGFHVWIEDVTGKPHANPTTQHVLEALPEGMREQTLEIMRDSFREYRATTKGGR